jgi:hypothetical protein
MLDFNVDAEHSIVHLRPKAALSKQDFEMLTKAVDPHIEAKGGLAGIIVEIGQFPGWESLGAMAAHFRFVRDHHKKVKKVAVVTDLKLGEVAEKLASHFVSAEIKHFPAGQTQAAQKWIAGA